MRTATIELGGQTRLLCFSTGVVEEACERFGSLDDYFAAMDGADQGVKLKTVIWSLAAMMAAGAKYAKLKGLDNPPPMSEGDIRDLTDISELLDLQRKVQQTITNGAERQVEAVPSKNGKTTPEPEGETPAP